MEEITLSEESFRPPHWKVWVKDHWPFLVAIIILTCASLGLLIKDMWTAEGRTVTLATPIVQKPTPKKNKDPFAKARKAEARFQLTQAVQAYLTLAKNHPSLKIRSEAAHLAKKCHAKKLKSVQIKKRYLEGYVLFYSYPLRACQKWAETLAYDLPNDPYFKKAKGRVEGDCNEIKRLADNATSSPS